MKKIFVLVAVFTLSSQIGSDVLEACGAKFLVATGPARYQRAQRTTQPRNILVFQHNNDKGVAEFMTALRDMLTEVGHHVTIAAGETALSEAARNGGFTVVMLELNEARRLKGSLESSLPDAAILPMAAIVPRSTQAAAKKEFGQMLALPVNNQRDILDMVQGARKG